MSPLVSSHLDSITRVATMYLDKVLDVGREQEQMRCEGVKVGVGDVRRVEVDAMRRRHERIEALLPCHLLHEARDAIDAVGAIGFADQRGTQVLEHIDRRAANADSVHPPHGWVGKVLDRLPSTHAASLERRSQDGGQPRELASMRTTEGGSPAYGGCGYT